MIQVPAIVTRETWELAQEQRVFNNRVAKRKTKREYLLRSLIKCDCGRNMVGSKGRYLCGGRYVYPPNPLQKPCLEPMLNSNVLDSVVWHYVLELITSEEQFAERLRNAQEMELVNQRPLENELEH